MYAKIVVIGGGLAGLTSASLLARQQYDVTLIERKTYPFHRVCGEYVSNEVIPFLTRHGLFPSELNPIPITQFELSSVNGKKLEMPLDLGGFGISRYDLDQWLVKKAIDSGVKVMEGQVVEYVKYHDNLFEILLRSGSKLDAHQVIGAFGKRSNLDKVLDRSFINQRSPYVGVKYHIRTDAANPAAVALHNFEGGYCGVNRVAEDIYNLCYLSKAAPLKKLGNIQALNREVLSQNPNLKQIFDQADFLFEEPIAINEITFSRKEPVFDHILMCGDAAGMITPLCGNGMAMAIHAAKLVVDEIVRADLQSTQGRAKMEANYTKKWNRLFATRLWTGRQIQGLFGTGNWSNQAVATAKKNLPLTRWLMKQTHGKPFE